MEAQPTVTLLPLCFNQKCPTWGFLLQNVPNSSGALPRKVRGTDRKIVSLVRLSNWKRVTHEAQQRFSGVNDKGFLPDYSTLSSLMVCYADNGLFSEAQHIWDEILNSSFAPDIQLVSKLINAYGKFRKFDEIIRVIHQLKSRDFDLFPEVYIMAISCFGKEGELDMMEYTLKQLVLQGYSVDSAIANAFIRYYSMFGSLTEMERAYGRFKRSRILIDSEAIRAMSFAYIKKQKFFRLGKFLRDVGLGRKNVGNLLWNLLLLSYVSNFKMKSLQREFLNMVEAGFHPDITTFNIRALAFSRMSLFWDLHLSLEHMKHEKVIPDLVTYGCVVDAYMAGRLGKNLMFALNRLNTDDSPLVSTDPFVFEVLGKGDFHLSSEALLEYTKQRKWTYRELLATYIRKKYRSSQIFWNY